MTDTSHAPSAISRCRICGNTELVPVLALGEQALTGVFPKTRDTAITRGPLTLLKCANGCGLLQLAHSYPLAEMYGDNYGYRSGINPSMVAHLKNKVAQIAAFGLIESGDIVVDIGSNDGTTLHQYAIPGITRVGIDPTAAKFRHYYQQGITLIADFFSARAFRDAFGTAKARIVTSFAMFYDMEDPIAFMREVADILHDKGLWIFEQSYMPLMLATNAYDTVCHEHLEYYGLAQIQWMAERAGLEIVDVELNDINGGSFSVTAQKKGGAVTPRRAVAALMEQERRQKLDDLQTYLDFGARVEKSRTDLLAFLHGARDAGRKVVGLGASTKGNVVLQYCGIDTALLPVIGEVNADKFGAFTPGSLIPIADEKQVLAAGPDHCLVMPWHFRTFFATTPRYAGFDLVFPLPLLAHSRS